MRISTSMKSSESSIDQKPLVILAGWLGSKHRQLKHYARFYESLGFQVLMEIASPFQIFLAATQSYSFGICNEAIDDTIQCLARSVVQVVHSLNPSFIMFHVFSNGGGFLWEAIRFELINRKSPLIEMMRTKVSGVIFDSAPANYSHNGKLLLNVLDYCEDPNEKKKIEMYLQSMAQDQHRMSKERSQKYWYGMRNCSFPVPHLYVCSKDDKLTPYHYLKELIQHRERLFGKDMIRSLIFESSPHCQHFRTHQKDYQSAIVGFVKDIERNKNIFSKNNRILRSRL